MKENHNSLNHTVMVMGLGTQCFCVSWFLSILSISFWLYLLVLVLVFVTAPPLSFMCHVKSVMFSYLFIPESSLCLSLFLVFPVLFLQSLILFLVRSVFLPCHVSLISPSCVFLLFHISLLSLCIQSPLLVHLLISPRVSKFQVFQLSGFKIQVFVFFSIYLLFWCLAFPSLVLLVYLSLPLPYVCSFVQP